MHDPADIALVYSHAECHRGTNHLGRTVEKSLERGIAPLRRHAGMITHHPETKGGKRLACALSTLSRQAVDDARVLRVFRGHRGYEAHTGLFVGVRVGTQGDIGTVERSEQAIRVVQAELGDYIVARKAVGSRRQGNDRNRRELSLD